MATLFTTENNNTYYYGSKNAPILYFPPKLEAAYTKKNTEVTKNYYARKLLFLEEHHIVQKRRHENKDTNYVLSESDIIKCLENCNNITFELTEKCNLQCTYCIYGSEYSNHDERCSTDLEFIDIKATIDYMIAFWHQSKFPKIVHIGLYGGEPLLKIDVIEKFIKYCGQISEVYHLPFQFNMTTNATFLRKHIGFLVKNNINLLVSIDGNKQHNIYRKMKNNDDSFNVVIDNVNYVKENYPNYFEANVNFNSVLHVHSNIDEISFFFKKQFGKLPKYSLINHNINSDEILYKGANVQDCICKEDYKYIHTAFASEYDLFFRYFYNHFDTYADFWEIKSPKVLYTGTCFPFTKKLFVTAKGKILPCETIGHSFPLGMVKNGEVKMDFEEISEIYTSLIKNVLKQCQKCSFRDFCDQCIFIDIYTDKNKRSCKKSKDALQNYLSYRYSFFEKNRDIANKIWKEYYYEQ